MTKDQSDSKKKCLILKNIWTKRLGYSRENRCKWVNILGVTRKWQYIKKEIKCKFFVKNNIVNPFRRLNDKPGKLWRCYED